MKRAGAGWAIVIGALGCADWLDIPDSPRWVSSTRQAPDAEVTPAVPPAADDSPDTSGSDPSESPAAASDASVARDAIDASSSEPAVADAALAPSSRDAEATEDATSAPLADAALACSGVEVFGICWYVGAQGASCVETCAAHGGYRDAASAYVGTVAQGGSAAECDALLSALGEGSPASEGQRTDGAGLGCHLFGAQRDPYWLESPSFDAASRLGAVRVVCGCER